MKKNYLFIAIFTCFGFLNECLYAQMDQLRGDDREYRIGLHSGNQIRTTFFNDGTWGGNTQNTPGMSIVKTQIPGEWPINSGHWYIIDGDLFILSEVYENYDASTRNFRTTPGSLRRIQSTVKASPGGGTPGDKNPLSQTWWTFLPLPGFANPTDQIIAMAKGGKAWFNQLKGSSSWPSYWPDIRDPNNPYKIYSPDGWAGSWNGYFGRDRYNADEESYFVADDYAKQEFPNFRPSIKDVSRGGLGIRMYVRGFQWAKTAVQNSIFIVSDLENIGDYQHNKVVFGYKIGNNMGQTNAGSDAGDDGGSYIIAENLCWTWDRDGNGASDWNKSFTSPVGISGAVLLETPGNPYDGIDNDNDGNPSYTYYGMKNRVIGATLINTASGLKSVYAGSGPTVTTALWAPRVLRLDDEIILINYNDPHYKRRKTTLRAELPNVSDTLIIPFGGRTYKYVVGDTLKEIGDNLYDDNLNGLIDENRGVTTRGVTTYLYLGHKYIDYYLNDVTTNGSLNPLIDERRDDGIDNNGNWVATDARGANDDAGQDGLAPGDLDYPGPDLGERDGIPTPGETNFDKTDINESDMIGLTSFNLYQWNVADSYGTGKQDDDEGFWNRLTPGSFYAYASDGNVELLFGSGYFPLPPKTLERISYGFICAAGPSGGWTYGGGAITAPYPNEIQPLLDEKKNVQLAYDQNYNFSRPPAIPEVRVVVGNKRVTLFWDKRAEQIPDPISGLDFEGYKIYRSTDPGWNDCTPITDARGNVIWRKPIAQFDIDQTGQDPDYKGYAAIPTQGVHFWLGENTGLRHYWVDTNVVNGRRYFYAVTSYDRGDVAKGVDPSECSKFIAVNSDGSVDKGINVVEATPNAPSAGYIPADFDTSLFKIGKTNTASGSLSYKIIDPSKIRDNHTFKISFTDRDSVFTSTSVQQGAAMISANLKATRGFTLVDTTTKETILFNVPLFDANDEQLFLVNKLGFTLSFLNNPGLLGLNTSATANAGWSRVGIGLPDYLFRPHTSGNSLLQPVNVIPSGDYRIEFGNVGIGRSTAYIIYLTSTARRVLPSRHVNFKVINTMNGKEELFAFREIDSTMGRGLYDSVAYGARMFFPGVFSFNKTARTSDEIILLNVVGTDTFPSWNVRFQIYSPTQPDTAIPQPTDWLNLPLTHPFLSNDTYTFTTKGIKMDMELAKTQLDKIRVVPNPYIVTNSWEPTNPYSSGRGERVLHFTHLPQNCTISIFNARGQLVKTIHRSSTIDNGTESWNMLTKDNLDIAYGIYIFHVEAPGIGEKIGKFVVIK